MATLDPIKVEASNWGAWVREAWQLSWRRPGQVLLMIAGALVAAYLAIQLHMRCTFLLPYPLIAGWGVLLARQSDAATALRADPADARRGMCLLGAIGAGLTLFLVVAVHALSVAFPLAPSAVPASVVGMLERSAGDCMVTCGEWVVCGDLAFFVPLCVLGGCPFLVAHRLAIKAVHLNQHVGLTIFGSGVLMVIFGSLLGPLMVVLFPFMGSLAYILYRHVFGGEPPAKRVRAPVRAFASAGVKA